MGETETPSTLGRRVASLRERRGWTQKLLAEKAELSVPFISDIENDKRSVGSETLLRLADALRTTMDFLMKGDSTQATLSRKPVVIPPELAAAAEEKGWSYTFTSKLVEVEGIVAARRGGGAKPAREWSKQDWIDLEELLSSKEKGDRTT